LATQCPAAERHDEARFLRDRNETARRYRAKFRVRPACQRLESDDLAVRQGEDGLELHFQRVILKRIAEPALQRESLLRLGQRAWLVDFERA
jgi:hypothetical protein